MSREKDADPAAAFAAVVFGQRLFHRRSVPGFETAQGQRVGHLPPLPWLKTGRAERGEQQ
jgi:hypothetical protein